MTKRPHEILKSSFERKREKNPRFSLRLFASKLELSPGFLSKVLAGKKPIPMARIDDITALLGMDAYATRRFHQALIREQTISNDLEENMSIDLAQVHEPVATPSAVYRRVDTQKHSVLEDWYYLAILDLVDCRGFKAEPAWIAERLGLKEAVAEKAWTRLQNLGCVACENGQWRKVAEKILFPASRTDLLIQKHHLTMLAKAGENLKKTAHEDFLRRLFLGATVSTNEKSFAKAKKYLEEALCKAGDILAEGEADRVYYLAFQLFPLTIESKPTDKVLITENITEK